MPIFVLKLKKKKKKVAKSWVFEIKILKQFYNFEYICSSKKKVKYAHYVMISTKSMMNTTLYKFKCEQQQHEHNHDFYHNVGFF